MSGKTLSNSTLSLRFMQNAQRAKQLKEVEPEKAEVLDDGHWDVGREVREAWGVVSEQDTSQTITYEASYLPFIFSDNPDTAPDSSNRINVPKGRILYGVQEEVIEEKQEPEDLEGGGEPATKPATEPQRSWRTRIHPRPVPIQSVTGKLIRGLSPKPAKESKSAKEAIFDNSGVGTDLRPASSTEKAGDSSPTGFLKPSGVDAPPGSSKTKRFDMIDGAREKKAKRNREAGEGADAREDKEKKRRKKRQVVTNGS